MTSRPSCEAVTQLWDDVVSRLLAGGDGLPPELAGWQRSYAGTGAGSVELQAFPEPYLGSLTGTPKGVFLALQPGRADLSFQGVQGAFAQEIRALGSYSRWAETWPYLRAPWTHQHGTNLHHSSRLTFLRRWFGDSALAGDAMVGFELYPWHATRTTARLRVSAEMARRHGLDPIVELDASVFAFGADWLRILEHELRLPIVRRLGAGGEAYGSAVASRRVVIFKSGNGQQIVAEAHAGAAGPPSAAEVDRLRDALEKPARRATPLPTREEPVMKKDPSPVAGTAPGLGRHYEEFWSLLQERTGISFKMRSGDNYVVMPSGLAKTQLQFDFCREGLRHQLNLKAARKTDNEHLFQLLREHQVELDAAYGRPLSFEPMEDKIECRVADYLDGASITQQDRVDEYVAWFADAYQRMQRALDVVRNLAAR